MKYSQFLWLLLVSAIWGASHTLLRIAVPEWGSALTAFFRMAIAAATLIFLLMGMHKKIKFKENLKSYLIVGFLNASFPIFLFAYAARTLPASYLVILNSMSPIFNAIFSSVFLKDPFTLRKLCGILLGIGGIILLEARGTIAQLDQVGWFAMGCGLMASACYGLAAVYVKASKKKIEPTVMTAGSNVVGMLLLFPLTLQSDWHWTWGNALPAVLMLGILGSGFAFVIYYRLIAEIGAFRASLTTFVMPIFGLFWGWWFLDEKANSFMIIGVAMIIGATSLFMKKEVLRK